MVELAGIPKTTDQGLIKIINRMATEAGVTHFDVGQIDVVHRTSFKESAAIIIIIIIIIILLLLLLLLLLL